jgi:hypothetical protein
VHRSFLWEMSSQNGLRIDFTKKVLDSRTGNKYLTVASQ